jgi:hypothetical protein
MNSAFVRFTTFGRASRPSRRGLLREAYVYMSRLPRWAKRWKAAYKWNALDRPCAVAARPRYPRPSKCSVVRSSE